MPLKCELGNISLVTEHCVCKLKMAKKKKGGRSLKKDGVGQDRRIIGCKLIVMKRRPIVCLPYHENRQENHRPIGTMNGLEITMEIDFGASLSVISEEMYQYLCQGKEDLELKESKVALHT